MPWLNKKLEPPWERRISTLLYYNNYRAVKSQHIISIIVIFALNHKSELKPFPVYYKNRRMRSHMQQI